jgi:Cu/Zn superoxide dismutase
VLAKDAATGEQQWKQVTHLFETPEKEMLEVGLEGEGGTTETIETTPGHPFWVQEQGWTHAVDLKSGDIVSTADGSWLRVTSTTLTRKGTVYNFTVADFHTYFVGELGAWVHNTSPCPTAPKRGALELPKTVRSGRGVTGKLRTDGYSYRIDTNKVAPGEGGFHIHVFRDGKEAAKLSGRGGYVKAHGGKTLLKPSELPKAVRNDLNKLVSHVRKNLD